MMTAMPHPSTDTRALIAAVDAVTRGFDEWDGVTLEDADALIRGYVRVAAHLTECPTTRRIERGFVSLGSCVARLLSDAARRATDRGEHATARRAQALTGRIAGAACHVLRCAA